MDIDKLMENDAFRNLEPEKIEACKKLSEELKGKNMQDALKILASYQKVFTLGHQINETEKQLMVSILLEQMQPEEREKFKQVLKMLNL